MTLCCKGKRVFASSYSTLQAGSSGGRGKDVYSCVLRKLSVTVEVVDFVRLSRL